MLTALAVSGYRSLRNLTLPLTQLTLITGPNGSGKSSLYRALRLLAETAQGSVIPALAFEGGLASTLWAGPEVIGNAVKRGDQPVQATRRNNPISLRLGFASETYSYSIELGLPIPAPRPFKTLFTKDPEIKHESIWHGPTLRPSTLIAERRGAVLHSRNAHDELEVLTANLAHFDSLFTRKTPAVLELRDTIRNWRFYDHFRTDKDAPARLPQIGTRTPILSSDGRDLPAALQSIVEMRLDDPALDNALHDAFPGSTLSIEDNAGRFTLKIRQHGLLRDLEASELSDGTLRYLLWVAALLTPRPPSLMVLNEPETSLHPDLLPPLARLIAEAAAHTQLIVVSHSAILIEALTHQPHCRRIDLEKQFGETLISKSAEAPLSPPWKWPAR